MNIGIIGLPQVGKKTLFGLLVGQAALQRHTDPSKTARGVAPVQDPRLESLRRVYNPKKCTQARMEFLLPQKIEEQSVTKGDIFRDLAEVDVFCHVVRGFVDDSVYHIWGSVDPVRDIDYVKSEFILHDLIFVEKRIEKLGKDLQKFKNEALQKEKELLERLRDHLETERPLRLAEVSAQEEKTLRNYPLLSARKVLVVLNVSDEDISDTARIAELNLRYAEVEIACVQIAAATESEIAALDNDEERREFMSELGLAETALHVLTRECIESLGLISFFTASGDELRQWLVRRGSSVVEAAGKIHTDMARGFIRAEVIKYGDLIELGSEEKVKNAGRLAVKGRDYVVEDGDILFIRFNV
ncbi:MAG: redox-regulated ATPase YchF [Candidatus Latescibacterota bacterium]|nr:MAG: redox-regulated ATPase YchF [Candidatus Latescibacterota bacterium]